MPGKQTTALVVFSVLIALLASGAVAAPGLTELVSVRNNGKQGDGISGRASAPAASANGLGVAFDSAATNLVGGDTNGAVDVFVRDRASGRTARVSVSSKGKQGDSGSSAPAVSGDGRFVAFSSSATNLVAGDTNARNDIFVHDRTTGETTRVSVAADGTQGDSNSIGTPSISADGRFVAFVSDASNLVPHGGSIRQAYVKDRSTGAIELVSVDSAGNPAGGFVAASPVLSGDGRFVAFASGASNLVADDTNETTDVFVHDRVSGATVLASVDSAGGQSNDVSFRPDLNADGRFVTFDSAASNLVAGDTNGVPDVFVHDFVTGATERVSVDSAGGEANGQSVGPGIRGGSAFGARISGDGRLVAFDSIATNLVAGDTNTCGPFYTDIPGQCPDVFVHDRLTGETVRVSVDSADAQANDASTDPDISSDGSTIAFFSAASNLVAEDTNTCPGFTTPGHCPDIFVHVG
jgi:Tol biopolymer transport system component